MNVTSASTASQVYQTNKTTVTKATSAYENVTSSQPVDKMDEMKEKYKDVYTPIPETYTKGSEELQQAKIKEAYPNYISGPDFLKIVDSFYDGPPKKLGVKFTQEVIDKEKIAFDKAYELFGGHETYIEMRRGSMKIMEDYPVNNFGKDERVHNSTELAKFTNASVYEGLEQGKTIEEAKIYAGNLRSSFMDTNYSTINFLETLIKAGRADSDALSQEPIQTKVDLDNPHRSTMDLRKYNIEANWESYNIYESQTAMTSEIEKKLNQFNFMLNNEDKIKEAYSELDGSSQSLGNNAGYKRMIEEKYMPMMEDGLNIFENYKIYDSIDIKG